jgi:chromosome segregation ATPase
MEPDGQNATPVAEVSELEAEFQREAAAVPAQKPTPEPTLPETPQGSFSHTTNTLKETDVKIAAKIESLKADAKSELDQLKGLKTAIAKKIADIKELEETREKIKKELDKIAGLQSEVDSITEEAKHELGES